MPKIAGVATQKNAMNEITHVTINMKKHGATFNPILKEMGVIEKTQFEKDWEQSISLEDFENKVLTHVRSLWDK